MKKIIKVLNVLVNTALVAILIFSLVIGISMRNSHERIPSFKGYQMLTILSGSMEPAIMTGDVIIEKVIGQDEVIQDGEVITFRSKKDPNMLITHRVGGIIEVNGKVAAYVTKGDANKTQDLDTVAREQVVGKYYMRIPYFGYLTDFIRKPAGIVLLVILPGVYLIGSEGKKIYQALKEEEEKENERAIQQGGGL